MALRGRTRQSRERISNPAELILVNPGRKGSPKYKRRASASSKNKTRVRKEKDKDIKMALTRRRKPVRRKAAVKRRPAARKRVARKPAVRKSARRVAAAKKAAATRKRNSAARSRAGKKAAATRKRRAAPARKTARKRRANPNARSAPVWGRRRKSGTFGRRRKSNPGLSKAAKLEKMKVSSLKRLAKKAGHSTVGLKKSQLIERILSSGIAVSKRKSKRTSVTKKAKGRARKRTKTYRKRSWKRAPRIRVKKWAKRKRARGSRALSRAIHTIRVRRQYGTPAQRKKIKALGLGRRPNPSMAGMLNDLKAVLPLVGGSLVAMVGMLTLGNKVQKMAVEKGWAAKLPMVVQTNIAPITTSLLSIGAWAILRSMKNDTLRALAGPALMGGLTAAGVQVILGNAKLSLMTGLSGGIFGEYTALGGGIFGEYTALGTGMVASSGDDRSNWALSEYTALGGGDDANDWAMSGTDDASMWSGEEGVLSGGIFD